MRARRAGGRLRDDLHARASDEFLESIVRELVPGTFAVVAEMSEDSVAPVDTRMGALGGKVVRESREELVGDDVERPGGGCNSSMRERAGKSR